MWLSERNKREPAPEGAGLGTVTLGGDPAGVYLAGERRNLPVLGPGGYTWAPEAGDQVLVIKTGAGGEVPCVAAARGGAQVPPGTVRISNRPGTASITLDAAGNLALTGRVTVNGTQIGPLPPAPEEEEGEEEDGEEEDGSWS